MLATLAVALGLLSPVYQAAAPAQPKQPDLPLVHPLFSDHAVLQRDVPLPVWGWTEPGGRVKVTLAGQSVETTADASGKWTAKFGPYPAGGPHTLTVAGPGGRAVEVTDLLTGDVWICSGQSNMEWPLKQANDASAEVAAADFPKIRLFSVPKKAVTKPVATVDAKWDACTPKVAADFSAVGYFFGRDLHRELGVPIGLIDSSWGGTIAEAWIAGESVAKLGDFDKALEQVRATVEDPNPRPPANFERQLATWWKQNDPGSGAQPPWSAPEFAAADWKSMDLPGNWEDKGLGEFDGIVWFRKEVDLPEAWAGKPVTLDLGTIDDRDTTFLNGTEVGHAEAWNAVRSYKVPANVAKAGRNVIAVRVFDQQGLGGLAGPADNFKVSLTGDRSTEAIPLKGAWSYQVGAKAEAVSTPPVRVAGPNPNRVTVLYNGMIAPLLPFAIKGATWYQGESNANRAAQYRRVLPELIRDWRGHFEVGEFPFLIVQLANYMPRRDQPTQSNWAELREAQYLTTKALPNVQVALAIDIGEANDIHPKNKQEVGRRLALDALATVYGKPVEYSGPTFRSMEAHEHSVRLKFDHAEGLKARDGGKLEGFAIAGRDGHFVWADAVVDGDGVVVSSTEVNNPTAVRYAWADNPACNLVNAAGLPAVPFRTDAPKPGE